MQPIFQHVTVPVDGSATAQRSIDLAIDWAAGGGRISFCSVVDPVLACTPAAQGAGIDYGNFLEVLDEDAVLFCRRAHDAAGKQEIESDMHVLHGTCSDEILALAAENRSDAILIGTHGRSGLPRAMLGSVAEAIVRAASIPVVCVHKHDEPGPGPLAVALDASPAALAALDLAIGFAAARQMLSIVVVACNTESGSRAADALLADATERARRAGISARIVLREGPVADRLLAVANEHDCAMIVMGTHGRTGFGRLLGSVAAAVIERATIPVVTIRSAAGNLDYASNSTSDQNRSAPSPSVYI